MAQSEVKASVKKVQISDGLAGQRTGKKVSVAGKTIYIIHGPNAEMKMGDPLFKSIKNFKTERAEL